jgi:hypothetical protein
MDENQRTYYATASDAWSYVEITPVIYWSELLGTENAGTYAFTNHCVLRPSLAERFRSTLSTLHSVPFQPASHY